MKMRSICWNVVVVSVLSSVLLAGACCATNAAKSKDPSGDKPFFETWDEDMIYCSMVVAMDGTLLLFEPVRFVDKPGYTIVKREDLLKSKKICRMAEDTKALKSDGPNLAIRSSMRTPAISWYSPPA
ncbi:MAG: hypothetical protein ACYSWZ_01220 [Planctomycetota bacterium]